MRPRHLAQGTLGTAGRTTRISVSLYSYSCRQIARNGKPAAAVIERPSVAEGYAEARQREESLRPIRQLTERAYCEVLFTVHSSVVILMPPIHLSNVVQT